MIIRGQFVGDFWDILSEEKGVGTGVGTRGLPYTFSKKKKKKKKRKRFLKTYIVKGCRDKVNS